VISDAVAEIELHVRLTHVQHRAGDYNEDFQHRISRSA